MNKHMESNDDHILCAKYGKNSPENKKALPLLEHIIGEKCLII